VGVLDVDVCARTIVGPVVPYGPAAVGRLRPGRRYRFQPGWPTYGSSVLLLRDHDQSQRLGRAVDLAEALDGLHVFVRVGPGRAGDRALRLAAAGALGLSPGVELYAFEPDPLNAGVDLVLAGELLEVSLTDNPAFDWR
jgi:phage head maturation protease